MHALVISSINTYHDFLSESPLNVERQLYYLGVNMFLALLSARVGPKTLNARETSTLLLYQSTQRAFRKEI